MFGGSIFDPSDDSFEASQSPRRDQWEARIPSVPLEFVSLTKAMRIPCSYGSDKCSKVATYLYESPGMGNGPTVSFTCNGCRTEIIDIAPQMAEYFRGI